MIQVKLTNKSTLNLDQIKKQRYDKNKQSLSLYKLIDWKSVLDAQDWTSLKILILTKNKITDEDLQIILSRDWPNLQKFWLNQNQITSIGAQKLGAKAWPNLFELSLVDNNFRDTDIILKILNKNMPQLKTINLGSNKMNKTKRNLTKDQLENNEFRKRTQFFPNFLGQRLQSIQILNISSNKLGAYGSSLISKLNIPNLKSLIVNQCHLGIYGVINVTKGNWPNLEIFQGGYNDIGLDGFKAFVNNNWINITKISLYKNLISRVGSTYLILLASDKIEESKISLWGMDREQFQKQNSEIIALCKPNKQHNRRYGDW